MEKGRKAMGDRERRLHRWCGEKRRTTGEMWKEQIIPHGEVHIPLFLWKTGHSYRLLMLVVMSLMISAFSGSFLTRASIRDRELSTVLWSRLSNPFPMSYREVPTICRMRYMAICRAREMSLDRPCPRRVAGSML